MKVTYIKLAKSLNTIFFKKGLILINYELFDFLNKACFA